MDIHPAPGLSASYRLRRPRRLWPPSLAVGTLVLFFADNHAVRVRRHESIRSYYGHLASRVTERRSLRATDPRSPRSTETICPCRTPIECPLRWADLDLLGHVNNVTYLDYLE